MGRSSIVAALVVLAACASAPRSAPVTTTPAATSAPEPLYVMDRTADPNDPAVVWMANIVERRPVLRATPGSAEMDSLKQRGVRGNIALSYVVDTLGRVEPGSVHVVSSDHPALVGAATAIVRRMVYRPGRVRGKAVRVLMNTSMGIRGGGRGR